MRHQLKVPAEKYTDLSLCHSLCLSPRPGRPKEAISILKDIKCKEETSSDSEDKIAAINKNLAFGKRKPDLLMDGGEVVEKRKKGRPRKDKITAPIISQPFTHQVERETKREREKMNRCRGKCKDCFPSFFSSSGYSSSGERSQQACCSLGPGSCSHTSNTQRQESLQSAGKCGAGRPSVTKCQSLIYVFNWRSRLVQTSPQ